MVAGTVNKSHDISKDGLNYKLTVTISGNYLQSEYNKKLNQVVHSVKIPGFRPGKVPKAMLIQRYGPSLEKEMLEEAIDASMKDVLEREAIQIANQPKFELKSFKLGADLGYSAEFEAMPTIEFADWSKLVVKKPVIGLTNKDLEVIAKEEIKQSPIWEDSKKAVKQGSKVKLDFKGSVDGEAFEGGDGKDIEITLGEGRFLKDFEAGAIGMKAGDSKKIDVTFPEEYHQKSLAGKQAVFELTINEAQEPTYHKLDQKWFEQCGSQAKTQEEFLEELKEKEKANIARMEKKITNIRLSDALCGAMDFPVPESLVETNMDKEQSGESSQAMRDKIARQVKYMLIIQKLADDFKTQVSDQEVEDYLSAMAPSGIDSNFFRAWYMQDESRVEKIKISVVEEKVLAEIKKLCKLEDEEVSFDQAKSELNKEV